MADRAYCTILDVVDALGEPGVKSERAVFRYVQAAADEIDRTIGIFVPVTATKTYDGQGRRDLFIDPCLAVTAVTNDGDSITSTQYDLYPLTRHWENGPYTRLGVDPDATELQVWKHEREAVAITGRWGSYEDTEATGATTTQADATTASIVLDNAAYISPGMVLLVESEQQYITATGAVSDSTADTAEAVDAIEEEIDVSDGTKVNVGEVIKIDYEQMFVIGVNGNTVQVIRGYNGTAKTTHSTSTSVYVYRTFTVVRGANGTTAAAHAAKAVSKYIFPPLIQFLAIQIAALMWRKASTGFSGRTGNAELGEVFYTSEFPAEAMKQAKMAYKVKTL